MQSNFQYRFTALALSDMDEILSYLSVNFGNPVLASNLLEKTEKTIGRICAAPYMYPDCSVFLVDDPNVRHALVGNYALIYEIDSETSTVRFLRFLYAKMDFSNLELR